MALMISGSGGGIDCTIDGVDYDDDLNLLSRNLPVTYPSASSGNIYKYGSTVAYDVDGKLHLIGGTQDSTYKTHYVWDGVGFKTLSALPIAFYNSSAVVLNNEIHIIGGAPSGSSVSQQLHYKWDNVTGSWSAVSQTPISAYGALCCVYNDEIHLISGTDHYKWTGDAWVSVSIPPIQMSVGKLLVFDGKIHFLGGSTLSTDNKDKHYTWDGEQWNQLGDLPAACFGLCDVYDNTIHAILMLRESGGGTSGPFVYGFHYKWTGDAWVYASNFPEIYPDKMGVSGGSCAVYNGDFYITAEIKPDGSDTYDPLFIWWDGEEWHDEATVYIIANP